MYWMFEQTGNFIWQLVFNLITLVTESLYGDFSLNINENYFHAIEGNAIEANHVLTMVGTAFGQFITYFGNASILIIILILVFNIYVIMIRDHKKVQDPLSLFMFTIAALILAIMIHPILNGVFYIGDQVLTSMNKVELVGPSNSDVINENVFGDMKLKGFNDGEDSENPKWTPNIKEQGNMSNEQLEELGIYKSNKNIVEAFIMMVVRIFIFIYLLIELIKLATEAVERWLVLFLIFTTASLPAIALVSNGTRPVYLNWCKMVFSQMLLIVMNVFFMKLALFIMKYPAFGQDFGGVIMFGATAYGILRLGQNIDIYLMTLGLNSAQTGTLFANSVGMTLGSIGNSLNSKGAGFVSKSAGKAMGAVGSSLLGEGVGQAKGLTPEFGGNVNKKNANVFQDGNISSNVAKAMGQARPDVNKVGFSLEGSNAFDAIKKSGLPGVENINSKEVDYNNTSFRNGIAQIGYKDGSLQMIQGLGKNVDSKTNGLIKENKEAKVFDVSATPSNHGLTNAQKTAYGYTNLSSYLKTQSSMAGEYRDDKTGNLQNAGFKQATVSEDEQRGVYSLHNPNSNKTDYYMSPAIGDFEGSSKVEINGEEFNTISVSSDIEKMNFPKVETDNSIDRLNKFHESNYGISNVKPFRDDYIEDTTFKSDNGVGYYDIKTNAGKSYQSYPSAYYNHSKGASVVGVYENKSGEPFFVVDKMGNNNIEAKSAPSPNIYKKE